MNLLKKIQNNPCKYLIVAIIIMFVVFVIGVYFINTTMTVINEKNLEYVEFTVADKYISDDFDHHYIVVSEDNYTYIIDNDDFGKKVFNKIETGSHYYFIIRSPYNDKDNMHIVQVYNATN